MSTYIKQLRGINATSGIVEGSAGKKLYDALMGLGDGLMNYAVDTEKRKLSRYEYMKEQIKKASPEELEKLGNIDLLNKYGKAQLADNPYAVAAIEEYRGQYFSDKFNQEYAILKSEEPVKTVEEEVARYTEMKQKYFEDNLSASYNDDSFSRGFFATNYTDINNQANAKVAEQSKSLMAIRDGGIIAKLDTTIQNNLTSTPEEMATAVQDVFHDAMLTGLQDDRRMALAQGMLESIAKQTGSSDMLDALGEVTMWTDDYGNPVKAKDRIAMSTYYDIADQKLRAAPNEWYRNELYKISKIKSKSEMDEYISGLTPRQKRQLAPALGGLATSIAGREEQEARRKVYEAGSQLKTQAGVQGASLQLRRYLAGYADNITAKPDDAYQAAMEYLASSEYQDLDDATKTQVFGRILMWQCNSRMRNEYKSKWENALASIPYDNSLNFNAENGIMTAMSMWRSNPIAFQFAFGDKLSKEFNVIKNLSDFRGSTEAGIQMYKDGAIALADPDRREQIEKQVSENAFADKYVTITDADGNNQNISIGDPLLYGTVKDSYKYLMAVNMDSDTALNVISNGINQMYVSYVDPNGAVSVYPRAVFTAQTKDAEGNYIEGIWGDSPIDSATGYMNQKISDAQQYYPAYTFRWYYDPSSNSMIFRSLDGQFKEGEYGMKEFRDNVNEWSRKQDEERKRAEAEASENPEDPISPDATVVSTGTRRATLLSPEEMRWVNS